MSKLLLLVALCCAALALAEGASFYNNNGRFVNTGDVETYYADLGNGIYGGMNLVVQLNNHRSSTPFLAVAGINPTPNTFTTLEVRSGNANQYGTEYDSSEVVWSTTVEIGPGPIQFVGDLDNEDLDATNGLLQARDLFAVLLVGADADFTTFVGPWNYFSRTGLFTRVRFEGSQSQVPARTGPITYDTFKGTLQVSNGLGSLDVSVQSRKNLNRPYPSVNIVPNTFLIYSQFPESDDLDGLQLASFTFEEDRESFKRVPWLLSLEARRAIIQGTLSFYVIDNTSGLWLRGAVTSLRVDGQPNIE